MASKDQHGGMSLYDGGNKPEYFPNTLFKRETPLDAAGAPFVLNQTDIVSVFKGDGKAMPLIMLKNNMTFNVRIRPADPHDSFVKAWYATSPQSRYSGLALHRDDSEFHLIGQAYFRPMAVLTNGRCYSACDGFASVVQDNALDELTTKNGKYSMQISISFATLVRTGLYDGQWVEDIGIKQKWLFLARISDMCPTLLNSQYDRISKHLDDVGKSTGKRDLYFISEPQNYKISAGQLSVDAEIAGMDYISVQNENLGTDISVQEISTSRKHVSLFSNYTFASLGNHHLVVTGKAKGKQVLKTYRSVSIVPKVEDRHNLASSPFVFNGPSKSVGIYNDRRAISKVNGTTNSESGLLEMVDGGVETQLLRSPSIYAFGLIDGLSGNVSVPQSVSYTTLSQEFSVSLMFSSNAGGYAGPVLNALSVQVSA
ncbi:hypothetical protein BASA83_010893 [Batrachochytrium salamandrivorans]|nr:hypothetical protein BASA83_010893 [Batrachochytrium salamandrivorans]